MENSVYFFYFCASLPSTKPKLQGIGLKKENFKTVCSKDI